jgi:hypothetical protein
MEHCDQLHIEWTSSSSTRNGLLPSLTRVIVSKQGFDFVRGGMRVVAQQLMELQVTLVWIIRAAASEHRDQRRTTDGNVDGEYGSLPSRNSRG